jgi:hypothetical protein
MEKFYPSKKSCYETLLPPLYFFNNDYFFLGLLSFASISATGINWYGQNEEYKSSQKNTKNVFNFSKFDNIAEAEAAGSAQKLFLATYLLNVIGAAILNNSPSYLFVFSVKETQYTHYQTNYNNMKEKEFLFYYSINY